MPLLPDRVAGSCGFTRALLIGARSAYVAVLVRDVHFGPFATPLGHAYQRFTRPVVRALSRRSGIFHFARLPACDEPVCHRLNVAFFAFQLEATSPMNREAVKAVPEKVKIAYSLQGPEQKRGGLL